MGSLVAEHFWVTIGVMALLAVLLVVVAMRDGIGASSDSVWYASAARSFAVDHTFTTFDGHPLVLWPVGYPFALGAGMIPGLSVTAMGVLIDVVAVAALVALTAAIAVGATGSRLVAVGVAGAVAIAQTTAHAYTQLWSEPLFIVASLAALLSSMDIAARGPSARRVLAAVVFVWLASNLRFIGVTLVPLVGVALLAAEGRRPTLRALVRAAVATSVAGLGTLFVLARNYAVGGTATGNWSSSRTSIPALVHTTLVTVGHWLVPAAVPGLVIGLAISAVGMYGAAVLLRDPARRRPAAALVAYVLLSVGGLIAIESRVDGYIDERYLGPVLAPSLVLLAAAIRDAADRAARHRAAPPAARGRRAPVATAVLGAAVLGVLAYAGVNGVLSARYALLAGPARSGYNTPQARTSALAGTAATAAGEPGVVSNDPEHVYWVTGRFPTYTPVSLSRYGTDPQAALLAWVRSGSVTAYIEFTKPQTGAGWSASQLRHWGLTLSDPVAYPDGTLYRLSLSGAGVPSERRVPT